MEAPNLVLLHKEVSSLMDISHQLSQLSKDLNFVKQQNDILKTK